MYGQDPRKVKVYVLLATSSMSWNDSSSSNVKSSPATSLARVFLSRPSPFWKNSHLSSMTHLFSAPLAPFSRPTLVPVSLLCTIHNKTVRSWEGDDITDEPCNGVRTRTALDEKQLCKQEAEWEWGKRAHQVGNQRSRSVDLWEITKSSWYKGHQIGFKGLLRMHV